MRAYPIATRVDIWIIRTLRSCINRYRESPKATVAENFIVEESLKNRLAPSFYWVLWLNTADSAKLICTQYLGSKWLRMLSSFIQPCSQSFAVNDGRT